MAFPEGLRVSDLEWLISWAEKIPEGVDRGFVISLALYPYYDRMSEYPLQTLAGDVIYRLSDHIPQEERSGMLVYPSDNGTAEFEGTRFDSLEDWRKKWELDREPDGGIPYFQPQVSMGIQGIARMIKPPERT